MADRFAPAQIDFSGLANLPAQFETGQQLRQNRDIRDVRKSLRNGDMDYGSAFQQLFAAGDVQGANALTNFVNSQKPSPAQNLAERKFQYQVYKDHRDQGRPAATTPGQEALDKQFAKDYAQWSAGGGYADVQKQLQQLQEVKADLEAGNKNLTGPYIGRAPDAFNETFNPDVIASRDAVEEVVQRSLRAVLGAQFTEKEGARLIARAYNPRLDEAENAKRVGRLITQLEAMAQAKNDAARYFEQNGTLQGWTGTMMTTDDIDLDSDQTVQKSSGTPIPAGWTDNGDGSVTDPNGDVYDWQE